MSKFKIIFEREKCVGCGACTSCDNWGMQDDGKVSPKQVDLEDVGCNEQAAEVCPIKIINIKAL